MQRIFLTLAFAMASILGTHDASAAPQPKRLKLTVGSKSMTATLIDSKTSRDFVALLPLHLNVNDLAGREKYAHLPQAISTEGTRTQTFVVGDIAYWSPGPDVAFYYHQDGATLPKPGIIVIAKVDVEDDSVRLADAKQITIEAE